MTIISEAREMGRLAKQTKAVKDYLEQHGSITTHFAIYHGLPNYGPILRLGARIWDLRDAGMNIRTTEENGTTVYTLIREQQPSWVGFQGYLKKKSINPQGLTEKQIAEHYLDYCTELRRV